MRENKDVWESRNIELIVITPSNGAYNAEFIEKFGPYPFSFYGDPQRKAFRGLGHVTMPKAKLLSAAAAAGLTGRVKNFMPKNKQQRSFVADSMRTQDVYIQGGTWIFNKGGAPFWFHIDQSPENHATINEIDEKLHQWKMLQEQIR